MDLHEEVDPIENGKLSFSNGGSAGSTIGSLVEWMNELLPGLDMPPEVALEDLRACLLDGTVFCDLLNRVNPGSIEMGDSSEAYLANVKRFLSAVDELDLPGFEVSDLEEGSMAKVLECLQKIKAQFSESGVDRQPARNHARKRWNLPEIECLDKNDCSQGDAQLSSKSAQRKNTRDSKFQTVMRSSGISGNIGSDVPTTKLLEVMKWNSLDKAPTQLLFDMVDKVLDESFERKSGDVPHSVACLLKKLVQEIERRVSNQADKIKNQNTVSRAREGKYQSRVRALETLAVGTAEENEVVMNHLRQIKMEKTKLEEKKKHDEQDVVRLMKEMNEREAEVMALKQELEASKMSFEKHHLELETEAKETKTQSEKNIKDLECLLADSRSKVEELQEISESKIQRLKQKEARFQSFVDSQSGALKVLRVDMDSVKREILKTQKCYSIEFQNLGIKLKDLVDAAENYHMVLAENRRLYNEVQDLKGNIRVYCRIRPFLQGQNAKQTTIDYIGENGELVVMNPLKPGKESRRLFKFNKVFAPTATQEEVFKDTQPLIRSVLDGYNVCIFAYGQTGSGKTYTMTGPDIASRKDWGVNYRALHDLFQISQSRRTSILYEVGVQMVEIYNEQVRDLLTSDGSQKRLGIWSTTQPNGLAVPDASMHAVNSTNDVLELMNIGFMNRAVGATALNERSSRSHSILTVHVRGMDLKNNSVLRGCLHLVDLAGSERVDRSEATGDRLREAQHINKSLSALGDVIFALSQKNSHVPYRNSKLTQVLQSSLGGQAKTLMFVQLNPDVESFSETISTSKFAERVSGVELGAARSHKEGRDVRELMDQVTSLKETIARKDEEIERLRHVKANFNSEKRGMSTPRGVPSSPRRHSIGATQQVQRFSGGKSSGYNSKATSDQDNYSEHSEKHSEAGSQHSLDELRHRKEILRHPHVAAPDGGQNFNDDIDLLGFGDADSEERLSDISDSGLSMGTETEGSISSVVEYTLFPEVPKPADNTEKASAPSKIPKPPLRTAKTGSSLSSLSKTSSKALSSAKKVATSHSSSRLKPKTTSKRWQ